MWKPLKRDDLDLTGALVYREADRVIVGGRWRVLADGRVVHETADGNWQIALHDVTDLEDPARFTRV